MTRSGFILLALMFSSGASAGPLRVSAGVWDYKITGNEVDNGVRRDFERDLAVQAKGRLRIALEFDWRQSWYPDLAASYTSFGGDGSTTVQSGGGLIGGGSTGVTTTHAALQSYELVLRWPVRVRSFTLSPGLALQKLNGEVTVDDRRNNTLSDQQVDAVFPQIHGELRWQPYPRLGVSTVVQAIASGGQAAGEYRVVAGWQILGPLLLQIGWQAKRYDLKQTNSEIHARLNGALFQAGLVF